MYVFPTYLLSHSAFIATKGRTTPYCNIQQEVSANPFTCEQISHLFPIDSPIVIAYLTPYNPFSTKAHYPYPESWYKLFKINFTLVLQDLFILTYSSSENRMLFWSQLLQRITTWLVWLKSWVEHLLPWAESLNISAHLLCLLIGCLYICF